MYNPDDEALASACDTRSDGSFHILNTFPDHLIAMEHFLAIG